MLERFTRNAHDIVVDRSQEVARAAGASEVRPVHLFQALVVPDHVLAVRVLAGLGAEPDDVRRVVADLVALPERHPDDFAPDDAEALRLLGIDLDEVMRRIETDLGGSSRSQGSRPRSRLRFGSGSRKVLELALRESRRLHDGFIGTEHLLLGLIRAGEPVVLRTLDAFDLTPDDVRRAVDETERRTG
jgi:ATP-dependent Clp protease ATP-binding subunit ClpA